MASQGPFFPATVTTESVLPEDDNDWTTPGNISADDNAEAQITAATYDANDISFRLKAQNLGFTIPSGATIDGIVVEIAQRRFAGAAADNRIQLLDAAGALVGTNKSVGAVWPGVETIATFGSSTDLWAASPTPAMVNDVDFGVAHSVMATAANTDIGVDFIRITVHYTPPLTIDLAGVSSGVATVTADLAVQHPVAGISAGVSTVTGGLSLNLALAALSAGVSTTAGAIILILALATLSSGTASVSGAVGIQYGVQGTSSGAATVAGVLSIVGDVSITARKALLLS